MSDWRPNLPSADGGALGKELARLCDAVAAANPDVLENPPPGVRLMEFGDSGLGFELRVWSTTLIHRRGLLTSALNRAIYRTFVEHDIEIPYPRRDIQILSQQPADRNSRADCVRVPPSGAKEE